MIEERRAAGNVSRIEMVLSPNRSLSRVGLVRFFVLMATASLLVSGYSAWQGNVLAPFFALLELIVLAVCLMLVWRAGERRERIAVAADAVEVSWRPARPALRFHPYWTRMRRVPGPHGEERWTIGSHGTRVEVGSFLAEEERGRLARRLRELLEHAARGAAV